MALKSTLHHRYGATSSVLAELGGVSIEDVGGQNSLCFQVCSHYGSHQQPESSPEAPAAAEASAEPLSTAQHMVTVHFDPEESASSLPRTIKSIEIQPRDVQCEDVIEAAIESADLQLLVRELRARVRITYSSRFG